MFSKIRVDINSQVTCLVVHRERIRGLGGPTWPAGSLLCRMTARRWANVFAGSAGTKRHIATSHWPTSDPSRMALYFFRVWGETHRSWIEWSLTSAEIMKTPTRPSCGPTFVKLDSPTFFVVKPWNPCFFPRWNRETPPQSRRLAYAMGKF